MPSSTPSGPTSDEAMSHNSEACIQAAIDDGRGLHVHEDEMGLLLRWMREKAQAHESFPEVLLASGRHINAVIGADGAGVDPEGVFLVSDQGIEQVVSRAAPRPIDEPSR